MWDYTVRGQASECAWRLVAEESVGVRTLISVVSMLTKTFQPMTRTSANGRSNEAHGDLSLSVEATGQQSASTGPPVRGLRGRIVKWPVESKPARFSPSLVSQIVEDREDVHIVRQQAQCNRNTHRLHSS